MSEPETFTPDRFIGAAAWQAARARFAGHAHQYVIRGRGAPAEHHDAFVRHIEEHGCDGTFQGRRYRYLDLGAFTFWASRGIYQPHPIINRRRNDG